MTAGRPHAHEHIHIYIPLGAGRYGYLQAPRSVSLSTLDMTAQRTSPPFRAEHLGSFKRPEAVINKRKEYEQGKCSSAELAMCEDEAIAEVVRLQKDMGLRTITDGEFRRY